MTRITPKGERNSISAMRDIFMLYRMRDPACDELASLIEILGTHGAIAFAPVFMMKVIIRKPMKQTQMLPKLCLYSLVNSKVQKLSDLFFEFFKEQVAFYYMSIAFKACPGTHTNIY